MTQATEKARQVLLFISHQPDDLKIVISFLKKRNFDVHVESDIKGSITNVFEIKPDFIFLAWDHPDKKITMLPKILGQSVASVIVPFINKNSKDAIFKIAGWNEDFIGWGGEDDFQTLKVKNFLNWTELRAKCYHLYHDRENIDQKWYSRNLQILQKSSQMNADALQKHILNQVQKIGAKNKYDNFV